MRAQLATLRRVALANDDVVDVDERRKVVVVVVVSLLCLLWCFRCLLLSLPIGWRSLRNLGDERLQRRLSLHVHRWCSKTTTTTTAMPLLSLWTSNFLFSQTQHNSPIDRERTELLQMSSRLKRLIQRASPAKQRPLSFSQQEQQQEPQPQQQQQQQQSTDDHHPIIPKRPELNGITTPASSSNNNVYLNETDRVRAQRLADMRRLLARK
jgi:hypothetical protein